MAARLSFGDLQNQLNTLSQVGVIGHLTDGQLVDRFRSINGGERKAAMGALVERHGPMVLGVCRQVLGDSHDVHDAFQATFLVLLRKAGSIRNSESVASWLHGVALRVARRARAEAARRKVYESRGAEMRTRTSEQRNDRAESWDELHEEIARLALRYREPLILCYLEGLTTDAAAQRLGCPKGTILSRLSRGRDQLRARLIRRGLAPLADDRGLAFRSNVAPSTVPAPLLCATVELAARIIERPATSALISSSVASLASGVLRAMLWTRLTLTGVFGLAAVVLVCCAGAAFALRDGEKSARSPRLQKAEPEPIVRGVIHPDGRVEGSTAAIFMAMPPRAELHRLLRRASSEAIALSKSKPKPGSRTLTTIAVAQAKSGDLDGARATFAAATSEAAGEFGGNASGWNLWRIGRLMAEHSLRAESRATLERALKALPGVVGNFSDDFRTLSTLAAIVEDQAMIGAREDARETVKRLLEFAQKFLASTKIGNARDVAAPDIAAALAALGDFEAAFGWSNRVQNRDSRVLGRIADSASRSLDRSSARRFVHEAADRLAKFEWAGETYFGWSDVALAQARLGELDLAKQSARKIGEGPSRAGYDMTDGQPYALLRIASVQHDAGDLKGAKATLRLAALVIRDHPMMRGRDGRLSQLLMAQIANGDIEAGVATTGLIKEPQAETLAQLARAQAAVGQHAAAVTTFARALHAVGLSIGTPMPTNFSLAKLPEVDPKMSLLDRSRVAEIEAMAGNMASALKTVRSDDEDGYQRSALQKVASARAAAGDVAGALQLCLEQCKTPEQRLSALEGLGRGLEFRLSLPSFEPRAR